MEGGRNARYCADKSQSCRGAPCGDAFRNYVPPKTMRSLGSNIGSYSHPASNFDRVLPGVRIIFALDKRGRRAKWEISRLLHSFLSHWSFRRRTIVSDKRSLPSHASIRSMDNSRAPVTRISNPRKNQFVQDHARFLCTLYTFATTLFMTTCTFASKSLNRITIFSVKRVHVFGPLASRSRIFLKR